MMKTKVILSEKKMKIRSSAFLQTLLPAVCLLFALSAQAVEARSFLSDEADVRGAVERAFEQLKAGDYAALYDGLPSASQARISRERFTSSMAKARGMYELDRLEIGTVRVSKDLAVVETTTYGRALQPIQSEGKIVSQQYLVRENGSWRVATGERSTVQRLLAANPSFARKFPVRQPHIFVKRDGRWVDVSVMMASMRRRNQK